MINLIRKLSKVCPGCNKLKTIDEFSEKNFHGRGKCRECLTVGTTHVRGLNYHLREEAHKITSKAISDGVLIPKPCEVCGESFVHAHHKDYSKPLEVEWKCPKHHSRVHRESTNVKMGKLSKIANSV